MREDQHRGIAVMLVCMLHQQLALCQPLKAALEVFAAAAAPGDLMPLLHRACRILLAALEAGAPVLCQDCVGWRANGHQGFWET
jgi:hypothetical protein